MYKTRGGSNNGAPPHTHTHRGSGQTLWWPLPHPSCHNVYVYMYLLWKSVGADKFFVMIVLRLSLLLCCVATCWSYYTGWESWDWKCDPVRIPEKVNMNKVLGRWYVASSNLPGQIDSYMCIGMEYLRMPHSPNLILQTYVGRNGTFDAIGNDTINVFSPSKWLTGQYSMAVVDLPPDGSSLTVIICTTTTTEDSTKFDTNTVILSKSRTPAIGLINARLKKAGVQRLDDELHFKLSTCPEGYL